MDRIATGHAIFVELLITLAGIQLDHGVVAAVGADDALAGVLDHDNLLGPWGRLSTLILVGLKGVNREQTHVYDRDQAREDRWRLIGRVVCERGNLVANDR